MSGTDTQDLLEGVTAKTTKDELMSRLRDASKTVKSLREKLHAREDDRLQKIVEIKERVKATHTFAHSQLLHVNVAGTKEEWVDASEILGEMEEILPPVLQRLLAGSQHIIEAHENGTDS